MNLLRKLPSDNIDKETFFDMCIKSKSGCNIRVGDRIYTVYIDNNEEYVVKEVEPDFELTEEEFKKFDK